MKQYRKKIVCLAMAVLMVAGLAACGKEDAPVSTDHTGKVLTIGIQPRMQVDDYDNNDLTLWYEEQLGIDIQFVNFALGASDWRAQVNAMIAAGERLPDVMWGFGWNQQERYDYGRDGYLIDLTELMLGNTVATVEWRDRMAELFGEDRLETIMRNIASPAGKGYMATNYPTAPHHVTWHTNGGTMSMTSMDTEHHTVRDPEQVWTNKVSDIFRAHELEYTKLAKERNPEEILDIIIYSPEESDELGARGAELLIYIKEARAKFCVGQQGFDPNNDSDWENYLKTLDQMGMQD